MFYVCGECGELRGEYKDHTCMINITLTEENLRDLIAGKIVEIQRPDNFGPLAQITVRELPLAEILKAIGAALDLLASDMDTDFGEEHKE